MARTAAKNVDLNSIRTSVAIKAIKDELDKYKDSLAMKASLSEEVKQLSQISKVLPKEVVAESQVSVEKAQTCLVEIQKRLDRLTLLSIDAKKVSRLFYRLDLLVKEALYDMDLLSFKTIKSTVETACSIVLPELYTSKNNWKVFEEQILAGIYNMNNAKENIKMSMKLYSDLNWAQRRERIE